ncbi:MAG TPA: hypothetical protein VGK46_02650 [Saprospiraceae bacterium]
MMPDTDPTPIDNMVKEHKARFRYMKGEYGWFWMPMNYAAETLHLMRTYGHTDTGRRYKQRN